MFTYRYLLAPAWVVLLAVTAVAQRTYTGAVGADDPITDNDVIYRLSNEQFNRFRDTITVKFYITQRDTDSINRIDAKFYWLDAEFNYLTSRKGTGWPNPSLTFTPTYTDTSISFSRDGFTFVFDSTKPVIEVDLLVNCVATTDTAEVSFEFNTSARPYDNRFFRSTADYWPGSVTDGTVTWDTEGLWPVKELAKIEVLGGRVIEIGDTVKADALITSPFHPWGGVWTLWTFSGNLDYVGIDTAGTLFSGKSFTATASNDSLWVYSTDSFHVSGTQTLFWVKFVSTATTDNVVDRVYLRQDSVFSGCDFMEDGDADNDSFLVTIPQYTSTIDIVDRSIVKNTTGTVTVNLLNNFTVDMVNYQVDSCAAFNPNESPWTKIKWAGVARDLGSYNWKTWSAESDTSVMREDDGAGQNSAHIPKSTSYQNIAGYDITALSSTGAQTVGFTRVDSSSSAWERDSKLKSYNAPIVIYSHSIGAVDSLFKLATGTVTVITGGGGGSCPFLMTWDGKRFVDENTILTQTEFSAEGVAVVDHYKLDATPALADGQYKLRIEERVDEISYLDEINLIRFDIPGDQELNVTPDGEFFLTDRVLLPVEAVDHNGTDVLSYVQDKDGNFYVGEGPGWLTVTYEGDQTEQGRVYLGHAMAAKEDECPPDGPSGPKVTAVGILGGEEIRPVELAMALRVGGNQWLELPNTPPRDYAASSYASTGIKLVAGERIEVRYSWTERWEADQLPLIVAANDVPTPRRLKPASAFHSGAGMVNASVDVADNEFAVLAKGEALELRFTPEGRQGFGTKQVFVVAAKGYYMAAPASSDQVLPFDFALHPNYPNPFNAQSRIDFSLPVTSDVVIDVVNILGQRVVTLIDRQMEAGKHSVVWDGVNDGGRQVASGTYFVRMRAGDFEQQRKMTLLK